MGSPTIYAATADGYVYHTSNNWNTAHDAATGTTADYNDTVTHLAIQAKSAGAGRSTNYYIRRAYFTFDVSGFDIAPSAATLKIYGYTDGIAQTTGDIIAIEGTYTGASALSTGDFDSFTGYQASWDSGDVTAYSSRLSSWNDADWNSITLNATARAKMASASVLSIVLMNHDFDYSDVSPLVGRSHNNESNGLIWADLSGTSKDPNIEYTPGGYLNDPLGQDMDNEDYKVIGVLSENIQRVSGS
tara:strand:+ start:867 stop:1601 length:735 start_codon:yes stop_codon:yes gene_type:complete